MTFDQFIDLYEKEAKNLDNSHFRRGQLLFNILREIRPDLSEKIRSTSLDPFYLDASIPLCWLFIQKNWDNAGSLSISTP